MNNTPIKVLLYEPDVAYRQRTHQALSRQGRFYIVGAFSSEGSLLKRAAVLKPAVVVIDPNLDRAESLARIRCLKEELPKARVLIYTDREDAASLVSALQAGACGYLLKRSGFKRLAEGIVEAAEGGTPISPFMTTFIIRHLPRSAAQDVYCLNCRDINILRLLAEGATCKAVAKEIALSLDGVKKRLKKIYAAMGVRSGKEAVAKALREELI